MKKLSILPALIVLVIGGVFAATQLSYPTSPDFPSMPKGQGTIGYILDLFDTDGTARNTERLGGVTASGYLQNNLCDPTKVWTGIDEHGKAICGTRTPLLVGNFTEGSMSVKRGTASAVALNIGDPIQEGDLLITSSYQTGTIQFAQDASYIRLDANTTVEIRTGTLGGNTVAEAILADGQLWGRIMTSTGVNLGGGGLVAGVRGTSVAIGYDKSTQKINISVIDSTKADAATITNTKTNQSIIVDAGSTVIEQSGSTVAPTEETGISKATLLTQSWVQKNTVTDISTLATLSGASIKGASEELAVTIPPPTVTDINTAVCSGYGQISDDEVPQTNTRVVWSSLLLEPLFGNKCRFSTITAFANYKKSTKLFLRDTSIPAILGTNTSVTNDGISITRAEQYIKYESAALVSLAGKTMTIELDSTPTNNGVLFDGGESCKIVYKKSSNSWSNNSGICTVTTTNSKIIISIPAGLNIQTIYIGNRSDGILPIGAKIQKISI